MAKRATHLLLAMLTAFVIIAFPIVALAQAPAPTETVLGVDIDITTADAIVAIVGGGVVTLIVQFIKKKVAWFSEGPGAFLLTVVIIYASTGVYFLLIHPMRPWDWVTYIVYGICVLGDSTGAFHLYKKVTGTRSTP